MPTIRRNLEEPLRQLARAMPVVAITGPRQSGKTTLCQQVFADKPYVSLEPLDTRDYALSDPRGFLHEYRDGAVFDEIQQAPELLSYLQAEVDDRPDPGRFILTGSQHFSLSQAITQTLAGRVGLLHLLPLSFDELGRFESPPTDLWQVLWMGSYPRIHDRNLPPTRWLGDYATTYLERDVRQVLNVGDLTTFAAFVRIVAGRTACELNVSDIGGDVGVSHHTARSWLSVLETSFLCLRIPPWHRDVRKRTIKAPRIHFMDSGLACHLLGITEPEQVRHHPLRGAIFESWVVTEIYKWRVHRGLPADRLSYFRDVRGLEVDLIVDEGSRLIAVEAKSAATVADDFFKSLRSLAELAEQTSPHLSFDARVVYGGEVGQRRTAASVVPWRNLHEETW